MFGDLLTVFILAIVSALLVDCIDTWIPGLITTTCLLAIPCLILLTRDNALVRTLLYSGWWPLICAMSISSITGLFLDEYVNQFEGFALISIVICGELKSVIHVSAAEQLPLALPGAVGSIYAARLSTQLHAKEAMGSKIDRFTVSSWTSVLTAPLTLFGVAFIIPIVFLSVVNLIGWLETGVFFALAFILAFCVQVSHNITRLSCADTRSAIIIADSRLQADECTVEPRI